MLVYNNCKVCGEEHPSPIAFGDKQSFNTSTLTGNSLQSLKTGKSAVYNKEDMFWRDEE